MEYARKLNERQTDSQVATALQGTGQLGECTRTEFLSSVSQCYENVTDPLQTDNDGSSTDEYEVDTADYVVDGTSAATAAVTATAVATSLVFCDVYLVAPRDKIAIVPCGHATLCNNCINTLLAVNGHCPLCRDTITTTVHFCNRVLISLQ